MHPQFPASYRTIFCLTLALLLLSSCNVLGSEEAPRVSMRELSAQEQVLAGASNEFAFDLLSKLGQTEPEKSFFVSPLSITMAFGMALNGTANETYEQMHGFFGQQDLTNDQINIAFRSLIDLLTQLDPKVHMEIANSVWYRKGFEVIRDFLETNAEYFHAEVADLDFSDPSAPDIINGWINDKTNGLIDEMIEAIGPDVVMYLINAIYFKADWTVSFDRELTRDEFFTTAKDDRVEVPMMRVKDEFGYYSANGMQVVDLPYGDGHFSFTAILPALRPVPGQMPRVFSSLEFENMVAGLEKQEVTVIMPRFEIDYDYEDIMKDLIDMGLTLPFDGSKADFSRINPEEELFISDVMHRAVIKVDEEGTEAAAATVIEISRTSVGPPELIIRLDRPFLFFIRENSSNTILFMGRYTGL